MLQVSLLLLFLLVRALSIPILPRVPQTLVPILNKRTFDSFVKDPQYNVIVQFYASDDYKSQEFWPQFIQYAQAFSGEPDTVIAVIDLAAEKNLKWNMGVLKFPTFRLYPKGLRKHGEDFAEVTDPMRAHGKELYRLDAESLVKWTNKKLGLRRALGGIVPLMEVLGKQFAESSSEEEEKKSILKKALLAVKNGKVEKEEEGKVYVVLFKLLLENGEGILQKEFERVRKILMEDDSTLSDEKKTQFAQKLNVIGSLHTKFVDVQVIQTQRDEL